MFKKSLFGVSLIAVLVAAFALRLIPYVGLYAFDFIIGGAAVLCAIEFSRLLDKRGWTNYMIVMGIYPSLMYIAHILCITQGAIPAIYVICQVGVLFVLYGITLLISYLRISERKDFFKKSSVTMLGTFYPSLLMLGLLLCNRFDEIFGTAVLNASLFVLLFAFLIPIVSDTFAMFTGSLIGGAKLCPKISPNKTVAGAAGAIVFSSLISGAMYFLFGLFSNFETMVSAYSLELWHFVLLGFTGSVVAQCGDVLESYIKRKAKVKNSGNFLRSHGGFLDRMDSHIAHALFVFAFFAIIFF